MNLSAETEEPVAIWRRVISFSRRAMLRLGVVALARLGCCRLLAHIYVRTLIEVRGSDRTGDARLTLLALSAEQFRTDLEGLARLPGVRVLALPWTSQNRLFFAFYPRSLHLRSTLNLRQFAAPSNDDPLARLRRQYRKVLERFLPHLYAIKGIDAVLSYHVLYKGDMDWGAVSDRIGVPYIVLHREGAWGGQGDYGFDNLQKVFHEAEGFRFEGSRVLVHTELVRQQYSGLVDTNRITPTGVPRMDDFLKRVNRQQHEPMGRLTLFPFLYNKHFPAREVSDEVHRQVVTFARRFPDREVVIKPKGPVSQYRTWRTQFEAAISDLDISLSDLKNLTIRYDLDAQDLILSSDVVCGLNSTTLLEAGAAGRHVVIPLFPPLESSAFEGKILFEEDFDRFDIARTPEEFGKLLVERMARPEVESEITIRRRNVFEKYVSSLAGDSAERTVEAIAEVVSRARTRQPERFHKNIKISEA